MSPYFNLGKQQKIIAFVLSFDIVIKFNMFVSCACCITIAEAPDFKFAFIRIQVGYI